MRIEEIIFCHVDFGVFFEVGEEKATLIFTQLQAIKIKQNAIKINSDIRMQHF